MEDYQNLIDLVDRKIQQEKQKIAIAQAEIIALEKVKQQAKNEIANNINNG